MTGKSIVPPSLAALAICAFAGAAHAHVIHFRGFMTGPQVVPPTDSPWSGTAYAAYDEHRGLINLELRVRGIGIDDLFTGGPNGHSLFFGMGDVGQESNYVVDLQWNGAQFFEENGLLRLIVNNLMLGGDQGDIESSLPANHNALIDELLYIELLTNDYPAGEIRGQMRRALRRNPPTTSGLTSADGTPGPAPTPGVGLILLAAWPVAGRRRRR